MEPSDKGKTSAPVSLQMQQLPSANKQCAQIDLLPRFHIPVSMGSQQLPSLDRQPSHGRLQAPLSGSHGLHQLVFTNGQSAQMIPPHKVQAPMSSVHVGFQPLSSTSRLPFEHNVLNPMPINVGLQFSGSNKRLGQKETLTRFQTPMPINVGPQQFSSTNKRPPQAELPAKVQTESFESVRLKLRESLAAALAMGSQQQSKPQVVDKSPPKGEAGSTLVRAGTSELVAPCPIGSDTSLCGSSSETLTSNEHFSKCDEGHETLVNVVSSENTSDQTKTSKSDVPEDQAKHVTLENEVRLDDNCIIKDELLQGHGLCWASDLDTESSEKMMNYQVKKPKLLHGEVSGDVSPSLSKAENLAFKIEAELFKLFGGVNKKYKEKGRSLLFNLKDRNNPELRERVLSGDIAPERLCSMTAEELASKELSEWRLAKAEELAQMVVLPDSEVDIRRLVKKTHKGEFQVEIEQDDTVSVEVAVGASVLSQIPAKTNEVQISSKTQETRVSEGFPSTEKTDSGGQNLSSNLDNLLNDKADFMQDLMVEELKDNELLPPIVSLDEFMEALHTEPPFENLPLDTVQNVPDSAETNSDGLEPEMSPASKSLALKSASASDNLVTNSEPSQDKLGSKLNATDTGSEDRDGIATGSTSKVDAKYTAPERDLKACIAHVEPNTCLTSKSDSIWEGVIQLNVSSVATVIGVFRSGEKTSTQEWPTFLEIKGRVRLDAFEKFLQELPLSRNRAIMIAQFCWKEGSPGIGRTNLIETIDSYIADERVGFAEPAPGVELYLCPSHPKINEMLGRHLPKDHTETLHSPVNGLIGVVIWRRPHVSISPRLSSHHKHGSSSKKQLSSRKQQNIINSDSTFSRSSIPHPTANPKAPSGEEPMDDIPPGFGPSKPRDDDDLPEFDFVHNSSQPSRTAGMGKSHAPPLPPPPARPVEQMRELILKYGQGETGKRPGTEFHPWNDDDDIPEWRPNQDNQQAMQQQLPLPPPPPPPPMPSQLHGYQQQQIMQQPFLGNQHLMPGPPHQQPMPQAHAYQQQLVLPAMPLPMPPPPQFQLQMGPVPGQCNVHPGWQQVTWNQPAQVPVDVGMIPFNGMMQPCHFGGQPSDGQVYGMPNFGAVQGGMGWRPDVSRNRGV